MVDLKTTLKSGDYRVLPVTTADQVEVTEEAGNLQLLLNKIMDDINSLQAEILALKSTTAQIEIN